MTPNQAILLDNELYQGWLYFSHPQQLESLALHHPATQSPLTNIYLVKIKQQNKIASESYSTTNGWTLKQPQQLQNIQQGWSLVQFKRYSDAHKNPSVKDTIRTSAQGQWLDWTIVSGLKTNLNDFKQRVNNPIWQQLKEQSYDFIVTGLSHNITAVTLQILLDQVQQLALSCKAKLAQGFKQAQLINQDSWLLQQLKKQSLQQISYSAAQLDPELVNYCQLHNINLIKQDAVQLHSCYLTLLNNLELLSQPQVELANGSNLIIETTQAMQVVDLNSGSFAINNPQQLLQLNYQALCSLVQQLELRNLGGIVVVDLLKGLNHSQQLQIQQDFIKFCNNNYYPIYIAKNFKKLPWAWTNLGLFEFTRIKDGFSLTQQIQQLNLGVKANSLALLYFQTWTQQLLSLSNNQLNLIKSIAIEESLIADFIIYLTSNNSQLAFLVNKIIAIKELNSSLLIS